MAKSPLPPPASVASSRRPMRLFAVDVRLPSRLYETVRAELSPDQLVIQDRASRTLEVVAVDEGSLRDPAEAGDPGVDRRGRPLRRRGLGRVLEFTSAGAEVRVTVAMRCTCNGYRVRELEDQ